ncbi:C40 family peptidase [Pseudalkalibacillus caeni]|uniref:C40 family peptidase n=1 Tax=Exobacillus caeni TaxID=2574798 RepID=UPI002482C5B8|nr:C40 family peptidase [Pseudalkalibacillus caeni]
MFKKVIATITLTATVFLAPISGEAAFDDQTSNRKQDLTDNYSSNNYNLFHYKNQPTVFIDTKVDFKRSSEIKRNGIVRPDTFAAISKKDKAFSKKLIETAKKYKGVPYLWGGTTPEGFDCSGFIQQVFEENGVKVPRTAESIWESGKTIKAPNVGDLVFFETYKPGPSHLGIYAGNNQFIHAGSSHGVEVSSMDNPYWAPRYIGAKTI